MGLEGGRDGEGTGRSVLGEGSWVTQGNMALLSTGRFPGKL